MREMLPIHRFFTGEYVSSITPQQDMEPLPEGGSFYLKLYAHGSKKQGFIMACQKDVGTSVRRQHAYVFVNRPPDKSPVDCACGLVYGDGHFVHDHSVEPVFWCNTVRTKTNTSGVLLIAPIGFKFSQIVEKRVVAAFSVTAQGVERHVYTF